MDEDLHNEIEDIFSELESYDIYEIPYNHEFNYCEWYAMETARFIEWRIRNNLTGGKKPPAE